MTENLNPLTTDYPAATGGVVTERHARMCREQGHATHLVDGEPTDVCPRCGDAMPPTVLVGVSTTVHLAYSGEHMTGALCNPYAAVIYDVRPSTQAADCDKCLTLAAQEADDLEAIGRLLSADPWDQNNR